MYALTEMVSFLETLAPIDLAQSWDNVGALVRCEERVTGVLCALDITKDVVQEAKRQGCNVIVAHHPVIFHPLKRLAKEDVPTYLIKENISAICMHTNLDAAPGGVNDVLANTLALQDVEEFAGLGRIGTLQTTCTAIQFAAFVKQALNANVLLADANKPLKTIAVVSGSGGSFVQEAIRAGADCLVTGEAGHHDALDALAGGMSLIAAGHFSTEINIAKVLAEQLQARFPKVPAFYSKEEKDPFVWQ